ncbi:MAG: gliding motility-associated C-terminal domain-containing protein [Bacteroidia bacterium]|nr:gliding motility-associated C-terminal domain-containing protein [Bacteroidia bacterium]
MKLTALFRIVIAILLTTHFSLNNLHSEGSKDFVNYPGERLFFHAQVPQQLKVFVRAGEFLNFGASHVGITGGSIKIYRPDGSLHSIYDDNGITEGLAIINNHIEERAGPTGGGTLNGDGYVPGVIQATSDEEGVWTFTLEFPQYKIQTFINLQNDEPWNRAQHQPLIQRVITAWDITVSQGQSGNNGGTMVEGRVYSNEYASIVNLVDASTSPTFYVLSKAGLYYEVIFGDVHPWGFPINSNSLGLLEGNGSPYYKSALIDNVVRVDNLDNLDPSKLYLYEPQAEDLGDFIINNKIFFNPPDQSLPSSAIVTDIFRNNTHETWLLRSPDSTPVNFEFIGLVPAQSGPTFLPPQVIDIDLGGYFIFEMNREATLQLLLDVNHDGDFEDEIDRALYETVEAGIDSVFWDMRDGLGNEIEASEALVAYDFKLLAGQGEIHIALTDIEENPGGITFRRLNGLNAPQEGVFYNHTPVDGGYSGGTLPYLLEPTTTPFTYSNYWGNRKYLDYWNYEALPFGDFSVEFIAVHLGYSLEDTDLDGIPDAEDADDDNDGIPDFREYCDINGGVECLQQMIEPWGDNDGDGIKNYIDSDDPSFFMTCDTFETGVCEFVNFIFDSDGDGRPNHLDADTDNDGILDVVEAGHGALDLNGDGFIDGDAADFGANGFFNAISTDPDDPFADINYELKDSDGDLIGDFHDLDSDNDGIPEIIENGLHIYDENEDGMLDIGNALLELEENFLGIPPAVHWMLVDQIPDATPDHDMDGIPNHLDLESDNDGVHDVAEAKFEDPDNDAFYGEGMLEVDYLGLPQDPPDGSQIPTGSSKYSFPQYDTDGDGIPDFLDLDSDNDGIYDVVEAGFSDLDNDGFIGTGTGTTSNTGITIADAILVPFFLTSSPPDWDGDGVSDYADLDSDNDGIFDVIENLGIDSNGDGFAGDGNVIFDFNGRSLDPGNVNALLVTSEINDHDNDDIPDFRDRDSDNDGLLDVAEAMLIDPDNDGAIGTGIVSVDSFGVFNLDQQVSSTPNDNDGDVVFNFRDLDSDNDGILDVLEAGGEDADADGMLGVGVPIVDLFGIPQFNGMATSQPIDTDLNGLPDYLDLDSDSDLIPDVIEAELFDLDGDGRLGIGNNVNPSGLNIDLGASPPILVTSDPVDSDGDGLRDFRDIDSDEDGLLDAFECPTLDCRDWDGDGLADYKDPDRDNDGILDMIECPTLDCDDVDGDGLPNIDDLDSDGDLLLDIQECPGGAPCPDLDLNSIVDVYEYTCHEGVTPLLNNTTPSGMFCRGQPLMLTSRNSTVDAGSLDFTWSFPNGGTFEGSANNDGALDLAFPIATIDMAGIYKIEATTIYGCTSEEQQILVEIVDVPAPANLVAEDKEVCIGAVIEIDATLTLINGLSFEWYLDRGNGNELIETTSSPTLIVENADPNMHQGAYSVVVVGPNCHSDPSNIEYITVRGGPEEVRATNSTSDTNPACTGSAINLYTPGVSGAEYIWTGPNGFISNEQNPVLENVNENVEGEYSVRVVIPGCAELTSEPTTLYVNRGFDEVNATNSTSDINPACTGSTINLFTEGSNEAEYYWTGPNGFTSNEQNPVLENVNKDDEGEYEVRVVIPGCEEITSEPTAIYVLSGLDAVTARNTTSETSPACSGSTVNLFTEGSADAEYYWTGPNAFASNEQNPVLDNVDENVEGEYTVRVVIPGCTEMTSESTSIYVNSSLEEVTATNSTSDINPACSGSMINLFTEGSTDAEYYWTGPNGFTSNEQNPVLDNVNDNAEGEYSVRVLIPGCEEMTSEPTTIFVLSGLDEVTARNSTSSSSPACSGSTVNLLTEGSSDAEYYWTGPNGFTSNEQNPVLDNVDENVEGEYTVRVVIPGCTEMTSEPTIIYVRATTEDKPVLRAEDSFCSGADIELEVLNEYDVEPGTQLLFEWYSANTGNLVGTSSENIINLGSSSSDDEGSYYVVVSIDECSTLPSELITVSIEEPPVEQAYIPEDQFFLCNENTIEVTASIPSTGNGQWSTNSGVNIITPTNETTVVTDLTQESVELYWSLSQGSCVNFSVDTLYIYPSDGVSASEDLFNVEINTALTNVSITANDSPLDPSQSEINILQEPAHGNLVVNGNGLITYVPDHNFLGVDEFTYELCNTDCPGSCDLAKVLINVETSDCKVPNIITPNADGMNDTFIVPCSFNHPQNELFIMNRWGDRVFSAKGYNNGWNGTFNGKELPPGTYFYLYRPNDGKDAEFSGFITLVR